MKFAYFFPSKEIATEVLSIITSGTDYIIAKFEEILDELLTLSAVIIDLKKLSLRVNDFILDKLFTSMARLVKIMPSLEKDYRKANPTYHTYSSLDEEPTCVVSTTLNPSQMYELGIKVSNPSQIQDLERILGNNFNQEEISHLSYLGCLQIAKNGIDLLPFTWYDEEKKTGHEFDTSCACSIEVFKFLMSGNYKLLHTRKIFFKPITEYELIKFGVLKWGYYNSDTHVFKQYYTEGGWTTTVKLPKAKKNKLTKNK